MSRDSDESDEMTSRQRDPGATAPGDQDGVGRFLLELRALGEGEPPAPSTELAALLGGATLLGPRRPVARIVARNATAATATAAAVAAIVVGAANHDLPQPAQRVVSHVVTVLTPFDITPDNHIAPTPTLAPTPTKHPVAPGEDDSSPPANPEHTSGSEDGGGSDNGAGPAPRTSEGEDDGGSTPSTPSTPREGEREAGDD